MTSIRREWKIGKNINRFEPPDVLWVELHGVCSLSEATGMVEMSRELGSVQPIFLVGDMADAGPLDAEARHYMGRHLQGEWIRAFIYYNVRLLHKGLIMGISLALEMTGEERSLRKKIHFVATREKAEILITQLRAQSGVGR